ncbi:Dps family protein [Legionella waltersii]|uniref:DNA binding stress protein n=1 Tax=Legionella waltersii TaxID=66969 RepID=A0A0W1A0B4_9GAMM|nr:DNA starvation/stationary phase protection protein [Legionella waltersii]KTD74762.1 DNA binding stress protein [Legionella waltersii]SNV00313.1 starvation-inducible DNA-binding protein [Legionella waltersii]
MSKIVKSLEVALADTYALYLKTQNYHWHVTGPQFKSLHELFEMQYTDLAEAVDQIAERLRILGHKAPATFSEFIKLTSIKEGDSSLNANSMVGELAKDNMLLIKDLSQAIKLAQDSGDEGTAAVLSERVAAHEKAHWMLAVSKETK